MPPIPEITVAENLGQWVLCAESHGRSAIVGPRILRGSGSLSVDVRHATKEQAEAAAVKLRAYLASLGKGPSKAKLREDVRPPVRVRGHWQD